MSRRTVTVELNGHASLVSGGPARDLLMDVTGRPPVWISRLSGFAAQEHTASKVVSLAESRGYDVVFTGARASRKAQLLEVLMAAPTPLVGGRR